MKRIKEKDNITEQIEDCRNKNINFKLEIKMCMLFLN